MIDLSIGVDIVSIDRIKNILQSQKGTRFKHRVFTESEIAYCQDRGRAASHHFAGRFAAKEAVKKAALSSKLLHQCSLKDIEILNDVLDVIKSKPPELDLVLTGNHAAEEIIELADLVTEMKEIKHPFKSGIKAKKGIDF